MSSLRRESSIRRPRSQKTYSGKSSSKFINVDNNEHIRYSDEISPSINGNPFNFTLHDIREDALVDGDIDNNNHLITILMNVQHINIQAQRNSINKLSKNWRFVLSVKKEWLFQQPRNPNLFFKYVQEENNEKSSVHVLESSSLQLHEPNSIFLKAIDWEPRVFDYIGGDILNLENINLELRMTSDKIIDDFQGLNIKSYDHDEVLSNNQITSDVFNIIIRLFNYILYPEEVLRVIKPESAYLLDYSDISMIKTLLDLHIRVHNGTLINVLDEREVLLHDVELKTMQLRKMMIALQKTQ